LFSARQRTDSMGNGLGNASWAQSMGS
jgi:hypothetical protein